MTVAEMLRRNRKMTSTASPMVSSSVILMSCTDSRMAIDRSLRMSSVIDGGSCARNSGSSAFTASTTATTLVPGCFCTDSEIARSPLNQNGDLSFSMPS